MGTSDKACLDACHDESVGNQPAALALYIVAVYAVAAPLFELLCAAQIRKFPIVDERLLALYARQGDNFLTVEELDRRYSEHTHSTRRNSRLSVDAGADEDSIEKAKVGEREAEVEDVSFPSDRACAAVVGQQRSHATPAN